LVSSFLFCHHWSTVRLPSRFARFALASAALVCVAQCFSHALRCPVQVPGFYCRPKFFVSLLWSAHPSLVSIFVLSVRPVHVFPSLACSRFHSPSAVQASRSSSSYPSRPPRFFCRASARRSGWRLPTYLFCFPDLGFYSRKDSCLDPVSVSLCTGSSLCFPVSPVLTATVRFFPARLIGHV
jgi:hypothetical protein